MIIYIYVGRAHKNQDMSFGSVILQTHSIHGKHGKQHIAKPTQQDIALGNSGK